MCDNELSYQPYLTINYYQNIFSIFKFWNLTISRKPNLLQSYFFETIFRSYVNFGTIVIIFYTIYTTPAEEAETVLDQTMNFTALLILISLDNELAVLLQKRIDKLDISFEHSEHDTFTLKQEFNLAADFYLKRKQLFPI